MFVFYNIDSGDGMKLEEIKGIGPKTCLVLEKVGITTKEDLLTFYPYRYRLLKRSNLEECGLDDWIVMDGIVENIPNIYYMNRKMNKMNFRMNTGNTLLNVVIFNRAFLKEKLLPGTIITVIGKYDPRHRSVTGQEIRFSKLPDEPIIEPVYHSIGSITGKQIKTYIQECLEEPIHVLDMVPDYLAEKYHFIEKGKAIQFLHQPSSIGSLKQARVRIKYEELFIFMLRMNDLKQNKANKIGLQRKVEFSKVEAFISNLPFCLTDDQRRAVEEIYQDLMAPKRMNRLIQGDVGSGKTIISFIAMYINFLSGYQSALMAPTEILARQHYQKLVSMLHPYGVSVGLLTGKLKAKEKRELYQQLEEGKISIVVGTHALISEGVTYHNLGLVITDEQHRFGVNQRSNLKNKGMTPDILYMSATPIPRTYALTIYGDMDITSIKTMPSGRKPVITYLRKEEEMRSVLELMYQELRHGHQAYVIAPLIEESEKLELENVFQLEEKMNRAFGKLYRIGILHGKMSNTEKEEMMQAFKENQIQILISTTVIEVGVDVANATIMVIFDSYRFGLSALHQLRGRVGRNDLQSYCILISDKEAERLSILTKTSDGFMISEEDFRLRGSGDLFGVRQSGDMHFLLADMQKDFSILVKAKEDSEAFLKNGYGNVEKYQDICNSILKQDNLS